MVVRYKRKDDILVEQLKEHLVMLNMDLGKYFSLNPVAARIWELLKQAKSTEELCQILINEFEVNEMQCKKEVEEFLNIMLRQKLIYIIE